MTQSILTPVQLMVHRPTAELTKLVEQTFCSSNLVYMTGPFFFFHFFLFFCFCFFSPFISFVVYSLGKKMSFFFHSFFFLFFYLSFVSYCKGKFEMQKFHSLTLLSSLCALIYAIQINLYSQTINL